jgi:ferritin-like metal-binding protein YciE
MKEPKDVFLTLLSDVRQNTERSTKFYQELGSLVQDPEIKEIVDARSLISTQALARIDRCFTIIGEKPVTTSGRIQETFVEDFRRELAEIQSPAIKTLFTLSKLNHLTHWRIGEYVALTAAADLTGHFAVGALLESCLADRLAFVERTRRAIRNRIEDKVSQRRAA